MSSNIDYTDEETQFIKFLEYFENFYLPSHIIAQNIYGETILPTKKGKNQFEMYSLDDICKSCSCFKENDIIFTPKTTDAIWYKKCGDTFYIFLIEFKGDYLCKNSSKCSLIELKKDLENVNRQYNNDLKHIVGSMKNIVNKYSDKMLNGLAMKPLETVTVSIPLIYEDYFRNNKNDSEVEWIDIRKFLNKSKIVYRVVSISENYEPNRHRSRGRAYRCSNMIPNACERYAEEELDDEPIKSYESNLRTYYKRYENAGIIYNYDFIENTEFNNFIKNYLEH